MDQIKQKNFGQLAVRWLRRIHFNLKFNVLGIHAIRAGFGQCGIYLNHGRGLVCWFRRNRVWFAVTHPTPHIYRVEVPFASVSLHV